MTTDSALGAMLGLALAECASRAAEPLAATSSLPNDGRWADGTSMALALAESLAEMNGVDQRDQMVRYTSWFRYGHLSATETCTDIDDTVREAILRFERTWNPIDTENTEGEACLTRLAPVAIFSETVEQASHNAALCAQTTHAGRNAVETSRFMAALLFHTIRGQHEELAHLKAPENTNPTLKLVLEVRDVVRQTEDFVQGCAQCRPRGLRAMAVYGQLAGAAVGAEALPTIWKKGLTKADLIEGMTRALAR